MDARGQQSARAPAQHVDETGLVERRIGIGRAGEAGDAACSRGFQLGLEGRLVFESGLAQARRKIDESRRDHQALRVDDAIGPGEFFRDLPVGDEELSGAVLAARGIDDASVADVDAHQLPATMLMTAILTAMPKVTCGRITERGPSATVESISTPRFMGPGCITMASSRAAASFSSVRP